MRNIQEAFVAGMECTPARMVGNEFRKGAYISHILAVNRKAFLFYSVLGRSYCKFQFRKFNLYIFISLQAPLFKSPHH